MAKATRDRVFLSYAHEDLDTVRRIYSELKERQLNVWFDKERLGPGRWKPAITKAIAQSRYFVICISEAALKKTGDEDPGFQDEELNTAYNIAQEQPDKEFTIIPVRLEDCGRGDSRLASFQQYDLFANFENGLDKLAVDLGGISLADTAAQDERTAEEKIIDTIWGSALAAYYANNFAKALTLWNSILEIKPDDANAWAAKGLVLDSLGRHEEALTAYDKALEIKPDDAWAWHNKGLALYSLGRFEEALTAVNKTLEIKPDDAGAWYSKGDALYSLGRFEEALTAVNKALEIKPDDFYAWIKKGVALGGLGRFEEALTAYDKALEIKPDDAGAWTNKGGALYRLGRHEEALAALDKALEIKPDYAGAWYNKGVALASLGRHEEALAAYDKALEIKPDFDYALQLKKVLSEKKLTKPKQAFRLFKKLFTKS